jgi:transcriptional regulator with XRE-family HTH domain
MDEDLIDPAELHQRAKAVGLSIRELCERAGVAASTFVRWKRGAHNVNIENYRKLRDVLREAEASQAAQ